LGSPTYSAPTDKERAWVNSQLAALPLFVEAYSPDDADQPITLSVLDHIFASWLAQDIRDTTQVNAAINIVGIRFGQILVEEAGFSWVIATDGGSSDLAVRALPGRGDVLVYPANFVAKRWERREANFMAEAFAAIRRQVAQTEAAWNGGASRPWGKFW
jgi:hypothetical protein